jgi:hypothetical protein
MTAASMPPLRRPAEGSRRVRQNAYIRGGLPLSSSTSPIGRGAVFHVPLVPSEEHAFEVCDPVISGERLSSMGRSTAGHGHPRVVLIASECNHSGRASRDAIARRCVDRLWRY